MILLLSAKKYYISKLLAEAGLSNSKSETYSKVTDSIEEIIQANIICCKMFNLNITNLTTRFKLCTGYLKCIKQPLVTGLLQFQKNASLTFLIL